MAEHRDKHKLWALRPVFPGRAPPRWKRMMAVTLKAYENLRRELTRALARTKLAERERDDALAEVARLRALLEQDRKPYGP